MRPLSHYLRNRSPAAFLAAFRRRQDGIAAVWFALLLPVIAVLVFGVLDVSHQSRVRTELQDAIDSATLAAARSDANTNSELQVIGAKWLTANLQGATDLKGLSSTFTLDGMRVVGTAKGDIEPFVAGLWLDGDMQVAAKSEVVRSSNNVEVSLVLDITGSMQGQKIRDLKTAAKDLVDVVVQPVQTPYYSKMAIVPYSMAVNVGTYAKKVRGTPSNGTCTSPGCKKYKFRNTSNDWRTFPITNCVTQRTGSYAFTDDAPSNRRPLGHYESPDNPCPEATILPLSSNKTTLKNKIDDLEAGGSTGGHIGVAWGWYMISPNFAYLWPTASQPAAYGTKELLKVVVLMTDGAFNTAFCNGVISRDSQSGSGDRDEHINCDSPNGDSFEQAEKLCENMKDAGVTVYTVGFDVGSDRDAREVMSKCATDSSHIYLPSGGGDLQEAFHAIGQDINALRLSR